MLILGSSKCDREAVCNFWTKNECRVRNANLSSPWDSFYFIGDPYLKREATVIYFEHCTDTVDFLPVTIVAEFPLLEKLIVEGSDIPVIKNKFFTDPFKNLLSVGLALNKIQYINEYAFNNLINLEEIVLSHNEIQIINTKVFSNNLKLRLVHLNYNKITTLNPELFKNLNLDCLSISHNECCNLYFGCGQFSDVIPEVDLKNGLSKCFSNCESNPNCNDKI
jgi:Leucine-rich repeat (LRR) protein